MSPTNRAAVHLAKGAALKVQPSTYTPPALNEIVVRNAAVAINPYDWIVQEAPGLVVSWVKLPFILVGDRVTGSAAGLDKRVSRACEGAFQEYTVLRTIMTSAIPNSMPYETACVLGLGLTTAACGLFQKDFLALPLPTASPPPSGKTLLVWGGSTSVGCNAIQLATAAGYESSFFSAPYFSSPEERGAGTTFRELHSPLTSKLCRDLSIDTMIVITTASSKNHAYLKKLGAAKVFGYNSATIVAHIISAFKNRTTAGAISIGKGSITKCVQILGASKGNKFMLKLPWTRLQAVFPKAKRNGVSSKMIYGSELIANEVGKASFEDFLLQALAEGTFVPAPEPLVVGKVLKVQEAMNMSKGVSAKKLVVIL